MDLLTVAATTCSLPRKLMVYEISIPYILAPQQFQQGKLGYLLRILRTLILIDKKHLRMDSNRSKGAILLESERKK